MKRVFITGVSSGIGHALAREYLQRGDRVFGVSRRDPEDLSGQSEFRFVSQDLSKLPRAADAITRLLDNVNSLDLVILNAGILGEIADMQDTSLDQLRQLMDVNVWANKTVLDVVFRGGRDVCQVVAISSGAAVNGNRGWSGYAISKAALNMLIQLYAKEQEETHFAALAPGLVDTAMQDYLCGLPKDDRFLSLENLKVRRHTPQMPTASQAGPFLASVVDRLPAMVPSGQFVDVRNISNDHSVSS